MDMTLIKKIVSTDAGFSALTLRLQSELFLLLTAHKKYLVGLVVMGLWAQVSGCLQSA